MPQAALRGGGKCEAFTSKRPPRRLSDCVLCDDAMADRSPRRSRLKGSRIAPVPHESRAPRIEPSLPPRILSNRRSSAAATHRSAARSRPQRHQRIPPSFSPTHQSQFSFLSFSFFFFFLFLFFWLMTFGWTPIGGPMSEGSSRGSESFIPLASVTRRRARVIVLQAKLLHRSLASQTTASRQGIH